jgi:tetratricopeptide (TPR) repeat protein
MMKLLSSAAAFLLFVNLVSFGENAGMAKEDRARFGLALSYMGLERYEPAEEILYTLAGRYPNDEEVLVELAKALGYGGKLEEAEELLTTMPESGKIVMIYASLLEANGQFERAREKYLALLSNNPEDENLMEKIADVSVWMGDLDTAVEYYGRIIQKTGRDDVRKKYADVLFWKERYEEAVEIYEEIEMDSAENKQSLENMGDAYVSLGKYSKALEVFSEILAAHPDYSKARVKLAKAYYALGEKDKADKQAHIVLDSNPDDGTLLLLAGVFASYGRERRAAALVEKLLLRNPDDNKIKEKAADIYSEAGLYEKAEILYKALLDAGFSQEEIIFKLAEVLRFQGKYEEAINFYEKL